MKNIKQKLIDELSDISANDLVEMLDDDYYRAVFVEKKSCMTHIIDRLVDSLLLVQEACAKAERYDLAIVCRAKLAELAEHINLSDLM